MEASAGAIDLKSKLAHLVLLLSILLFLWLRMRNLNHLFVYDEAHFVLMTKSFVKGIPDQWHQFIRFHPPLYLLTCAFIFKYLNLVPVSFELVSILFSLGTLIVIYLLASSLFGKTTGALSAFFFSILPASTVFNTWIKQDSMAIFFLSLSVYLFMKEKYHLSGIALGLGLLSKEIAIFALMTIALFSLACLSRDKIEGTIIAGAIGGLLSFWWYTWLSVSKGHFLGFFRGTNLEGKTWSQPWSYYFKGLPTDLGWPLLCLVAIGCVTCIYYRVKGSEAFLLPLTWFLGIYIFLSVSVGKPYWMMDAATPALAILAAIGLAEISSIARSLLPSHKRGTFLKLAVIAVALLTGTIAAFRVDHASYNRARLDNYWTGSEYSKRDADFFNEHAEEGDTILMVFNELDRWDAVLLYYLKNVYFVSVYPIALDAPSEIADGIEKSGIRWIYIKHNVNYMDRIKYFVEVIRTLLNVQEYHFPGSSIIEVIEP